MGRLIWKYHGLRVDRYVPKLETRQQSINALYVHGMYLLTRSSRRGREGAACGPKISGLAPHPIEKALSREAPNKKGKEIHLYIQLPMLLRLSRYRPDVWPPRASPPTSLDIRYEDCLVPMSRSYVGCDALRGKLILGDEPVTIPRKQRAL
ncbi:unnamed protein product, partial [Iphiclides podalirius]